MPERTHGGKTARKFRVARGPIVLENLLQLVLRIFRMIDDHLVAAVTIAAIAVAAVTVAAVRKAPTTINYMCLAAGSD